MNNKNFKTVFLSAITLYIFSFTIVHADIVCVDSLDPSCYNSIQEGIDAAAYGDTVEVVDGTYIGQVTLKTGVIVIGENPNTTIIWNNNDAVVGTSINEAVIQGFTITSSGGNGIHLYKSNATIKGNIVKDCAESGILAIGSAGGGTWYVNMINNIIKNNNVGISCIGSAMNIIKGNIWNNVVLKNADMGILVDGYYRSEPVIVNNVIYENSGNGIRTQCVSGSPYITNNIIMKNGNYGISNDSMTPTVAFNDLYLNLAGDYDNISVGPGSISVDPEFSDEASEDFHLTLNSPVVDAGAPTNAPEYDFDGDPRPQGGGYDIGGDEFPSAPPPEPCECDLNSDGRCNIIDYQIFIQNWGRDDCPVSP